METEVRSLQDPHIDVRFLDYGLHNVPEKMSEAIQNEIDLAIEIDDYEAIILGYGLCSNGIVGVKARHIPLVVPRVHDCISLFLGSVKKYRTEVAACPGTFYLTSGWIERGDTPVSKYLLPPPAFPLLPPSCPIRRERGRDQKVYGEGR
jgi:hypothetical protein